MNEVGYGGEVEICDAPNKFFSSVFASEEQEGILLEIKNFFQEDTDSVLTNIEISEDAAKHKHINLTLGTSEAGIPALRKLPCGVGRQYTGFAQTSPGVGSRYTGGTVCQRQASEAGIPALFFNAYWHLNARVIEI